MAPDGDRARTLPGGVGHPGPPPGPTPSTAGLTLQNVTALVAPTGLLAAVFSYFGYVSARSYYRYFGIPLSALDIPASSYLQRNVDTLFKPVASLLALAFVLFLGHLAVARTWPAASVRVARALPLVLLAFSASAALVAVLGLRGRTLGLTSPLALIVAPLSLEYAAWLVAASRAPQPALHAALRSWPNARRGLVVALALVGVFWTVTLLAHERGTTSARLTERTLVLQPQAVVYSTRDLHLPVPPGDVQILAEDGTDAYLVSTKGLRPLLYNRGRWFLLPAEWRRDNGLPVIVLPDDPGRIRVDLAP